MAKTFGALTVVVHVENRLKKVLAFTPETSVCVECRFDKGNLGGFSPLETTTVGLRYQQEVAAMSTPFLYI